MLMYANTAIMNPIRFLWTQKYARLPVSNTMIRRKKRTSALETSPMSLLPESLRTGLGSWYTAKLPAPSKSWWQLQLEKEALQLRGCRGWHCSLYQAEVSSEVQLVKANRVKGTCGPWSLALYFQELIRTFVTESQKSPCWKQLWKIFWSNLLWEKEPI